MGFRAVIKDAFDREIDNQMSFWAYNLVSETLETTRKNVRVNPLGKYEKEMPFHIFFASCVHCLLHETSTKIEKAAQNLSIFDAFTTQLQRIATIDSYTKIRSTTAVEKFFRMIENYSATDKGENYAAIMEELKTFISTRGDRIDEELCVLECLNILSRFKIPGISIIGFVREEKTDERRLLGGSVKLPPSRKKEAISTNLDRLRHHYSIMTDEPTAKLLRAIANQANLEDLRQLSEIVSIEAIINEKSPSGKTALHWLVKGAQQAKEQIDEERYHTVYQWLIEHGADSTLIDDEGKTALEYDHRHLFEKSPAHSVSTYTLT